MPYTAAQNRLFHAAAADKAVAKAHGMSQAEARRMAKKAEQYAAKRSLSHKGGK